MNIDPSKPWQQRRERFAAACVRGFHLYANWLIGISWRRFILLSLLLIAAAVEAFWSSGSWIPLPIKYGVAAICWAAVLAWLTLQGRRAS